MSPSLTPTDPSSDIQTLPQKRIKSLWVFTFLLSFLAPVLIALFLYQLDSFDPAPLPTHEFTHLQPLKVPRSNGRMLWGSERIGSGLLLAPEDVVYDPESRLIYTGCVDGWVKRVTVNESVDDTVVENWVNTGGRPLGLALSGRNNEVIIADADKGLLIATGSGVELLTDEAGGVKFKLTDGVDVDDDGIIYFTDASYKYSLKDFMWDILEGRPYGRLMSYDPSTKQTKVLVTDLYFPNGVAVSPDQDSVVFCETPMRRCKKYYIEGERKGSQETFIDNLPGLPDNIHYNVGDGHYWIALATEATYSWDLAQRYPLIRKGLAILERYGWRPSMEKNGGVMVVDREGKPLEHYYDLELSLISSGTKIGNHLYCGSVQYPYIIRLDLTQYPATASGI